MKKLINLYHQHQEVINYLFWGVLTTLINFIIFVLLTKLTSINYQINNIISWTVSALFAYFTNRIYVFHSKANVVSEYLKEFVSFMIGGRLGSLILENIILYIGVSLLGFNLIIMKIITQVVVIAFNYVWSKLVVFK